MLRLCQGNPSYQHALMMMIIFALESVDLNYQSCLLVSIRSILHNMCSSKDCWLLEPANFIWNVLIILEISWVSQVPRAPMMIWMALVSNTQICNSSVFTSAYFLIFSNSFHCCPWLFGTVASITRHSFVSFLTKIRLGRWWWVNMVSLYCEVPQDFHILILQLSVCVGSPCLSLGYHMICAGSTGNF